jgi:two-component system response regulator NreC
MKTASTMTLGPPHAVGRTKQPVVALALRDKSLAATLASRLAAERIAVVLGGRSAHPGKLMAWLNETRADVLLLDERWLPRLGGRAVRHLRASWPGRRILLIADHACTALAEQVVRNRFDGLLLAKGAAENCVKAVRGVEQGEMWVPRALLVRLLLEHVHAPDHAWIETDAVGNLTRRETEVIGYLRRGFANKQIADALAIREDTVKKHLRNAYTKLGVHRRSEIITGTLVRLGSG